MRLSRSSAATRINSFRRAARLEPAAGLRMRRLEETPVGGEHVQVRVEVRQIPEALHGQDVSTEALDSSYHARVVAGS